LRGCGGVAIGDTTATTQKEHAAAGGVKGAPEELRDNIILKS